MKGPREGSNIGDSLLNPNNPHFFVRDIKNTCGYATCVELIKVNYVKVSKHQSGLHV